MAFKEKARILDAEGIKRAVTRISHEILEKNKRAEDLVIIGIRNRGEYLGQRVVASIEKITEKKIPFGILDITLYRDDLTEVAEQPKERCQSQDEDQTVGTAFLG